MSSSDETQIVFLEEVLDDVSTERVRDAAVVLSPASDVLRPSTTPINFVQIAPTILIFKSRD